MIDDASTRTPVLLHRGSLGVLSITVVGCLVGDVYCSCRYPYLARHSSCMISAFQWNDPSLTPFMILCDSSPKYLTILSHAALPCSSTVVAEQRRTRERHNDRPRIELQRTSVGKPVANQLGSWCRFSEQAP